MSPFNAKNDPHAWCAFGRTPKRRLTHKHTHTTHTTHTQHTQHTQHTRTAYLQVSDRGNGRINLLRGQAVVALELQPQQRLPDESGGATTRELGALCEMRKAGRNEEGAWGSRESRG